MARVEGTAGEPNTVVPGSTSAATPAWPVMARPIANSHVICDAGLPAHAYPSAHPHASRYACLSGHNGVSPHHTVVANLNKVVELRAGFNDRVAEGGAVDARIGADLYAITNKDTANLRDLTVIPTA